MTPDGIAAKVLGVAIIVAAIGATVYFGWGLWWIATH